MAGEVPALNVTAAELWASLWPEGLGTAPTMPAAFNTYCTMGLNLVDAGLNVLQRRLVASGEGFSADDTAHGEAMVQAGLKYVDNATMLMQRHLETGIRTLSGTPSNTIVTAAGVDVSTTWSGMLPPALSILACPVALTNIGTRGALNIRFATELGSQTIPLVAGAASPGAALIQQLMQQGNKDWDQFIDLAQKHIVQKFFDPTLWSLARSTNGTPTTAGAAATTKATNAWQALFPPMYGASPLLAFPTCPAGILEMGAEGAFYQELSTQFANQQMSMLGVGAQGAVPMVEAAKQRGEARWAEFLAAASKKMAEFFYSRDVWEDIGEDGQAAAMQEALDWWNDILPPNSRHSYSTVASFPWQSHLRNGAKGEIYTNYGEKLAHEQLPINPNGTPKGASYAEQLQQRGAGYTQLFRTWAQAKLVQLQSSDWSGSVQDPAFGIYEG